jgi:glycosyltransferase involved in cell wall biosynthesis
MKVSVLMSVYNGEKYLGQAIESILQQTFTDYEFLILDDGSSDDSGKIIESYRRKDKRIKAFSQENVGLAESLNTLLKHSKAEYLARMDADDVSRPQRFTKQVEYLDKHEEVGVLATARFEIAPNSLPFEMRLLPTDGNEIINQLKKGINPIAHGSVMMRKQVLARLDGRPYRTRLAQDLDLWIRLSEITRISVINIPLYELRRSSNIISLRLAAISPEVHKILLRSGEIEKGELDTLNFNIKSLLDKSQKYRGDGVDAYLNGKGFFRCQQYGKGIEHFIKALRYSGRRSKALVFIGLCIMGKLGWILHLKINRNAYSGGKMSRD